MVRRIGQGLEFRGTGKLEKKMEMTKGCWEGRNEREKGNYLTFDVSAD